MSRDQDFLFDVAARKARGDQFDAVVFFHYKRKLYFAFALPHKSKLNGNVFPLSVHRLVPTERLKDEPSALKAFLAEECRKEIQAFARQLDTDDAFRLNPDIPLEIKIKGVTVTGTVVRADGRVLRVKMTLPYQDERMVNYGFGCAMSGIYMLSYDERGALVGLSKDGMESALRLLKEAYSDTVRKQQERPLQELVTRLNNS